MTALPEERDFLLRSLADLEHERAAGDIDEPDYLALKDEYTARAAAVLRQLEGTAGTPSVSPVTKRAWWRAPVTIAVTAAVAVGAGVAVARSSGQRQPGQQISGGLPAGRQAQVDELLAQARTNLGRSPVDALKAFDAVLKLDPTQVEAITYRGWLLYQAGLVDDAFTWLDRAVKTDPDYADARVFRGIVRFRAKGDATGAIADLEHFLKTAPDSPMAGLVNQTLDEAKVAATAS